MQDDLFGPKPSPAPSVSAEPARAKPARDSASEAPDGAPDQAPKKKRRADVDAAAQPPEVVRLGERLPPRLRLGTSSWSFPGWRGLVWAEDHAESALSKKGLGAYARHPLLGTVSLDRAFYRPLTASQYAGLAGQVPAGFRFLVKAPSLVADAMVRGEGGRGLEPNPLFLDADAALREFVEPAIEGLGERLGVLVFQLSPLPAAQLHDTGAFFERLDGMLAALPRVGDRVPGACVAVELRNPELMTPELVRVLRAHGATYCLGLHPKMPPIEEQLPVLRALWPGPLVARWSLNRKHGSYGYEEAKGLYEPFDALIDPDPATRETLARVAEATLAAGFDVFVTINNKAEGSAPRSVHALAQEVMQRWERRLAQDEKRVESVEADVRASGA